MWYKHTMTTQINSTITTLSLYTIDFSALSFIGDFCCTVMLPGNSWSTSLSRCSIFINREFNVALNHLPGHWSCHWKNWQHPILPFPQLKNLLPGFFSVQLILREASIPQKHVGTSIESLSIVGFIVFTDRCLKLLFLREAVEEVDEICNWQVRAQLRGKGRRRGRGRGRGRNLKGKIFPHRRCHYGKG